MRKRRSVLNHIGTVHAIAMCNLAEATGGSCMEASVPKSLRWIPKSMQVEYLKKATSNLKAVCKIDTTQLTTGSNPIEVHVFDRKEECVFKATIEMYLSEKRK